MRTAKNNPQMEEECYVSGIRLQKHVHVRNQCNQRNQLQADKVPHLVLSDHHIAVLKALIDYVDYTDDRHQIDYANSPQEWQHTDCRRAGSNPLLPSCAAGSGWCDNSCQVPLPPAVESSPRETVR